eukprot:scaffold2330_cov376-Prasinococcus_capsulatus_cf.AAC.6
MPPKMIHQQALCQHHLTGAEHAAPAHVGRMLILDALEVLPICDPDPGEPVRLEEVEGGLVRRLPFCRPCGEQRMEPSVPPASLAARTQDSYEGSGSAYRAYPSGRS